MTAEHPERLSVAWESPGNIAFVKYWGKFPGQLPMNPSLSMVLSRSVTRTSVSVSPRLEQDMKVDFSFGGIDNPAFANRIRHFVDSLGEWMPFLGEVDLQIESYNTFPHSAGIASSASAFSALALCLCSLEGRYQGHLVDETEFLDKAGWIARMGSGSACRSVHGGFSMWGRSVAVPGSSDYFAVNLSDLHPDFYRLQDSILVVDAGAKGVSSSEGHARMQGHAYAKARVAQANENLIQLYEAMRLGDRARFIEIVENEALSLHALMMASAKGFILMHPDTIRLIAMVQQWRLESGVAICFTLDAGPNLHLLYFEEDRQKVQAFIHQQLAGAVSRIKIIDDGCGNGPVILGLDPSQRNSDHPGHLPEKNSE